MTGDIEPQHWTITEVSRERIDYGKDYRRIGTAFIYGQWERSPVPEYARNDHKYRRWHQETVNHAIGFGLYGVRGGDLLVRYEGGYIAGMEHGTGWRDEPYIWVSATPFIRMELFSRWKRSATACPPDQQAADHDGPATSGTAVVPDE
jgi:hypothetical protein